MAGKVPERNPGLQVVAQIEADVERTKEETRQPGLGDGLRDQPRIFRCCESAVFSPGEVNLDGTLALGYVRSRAADSDYSRMGRQRHLLEQLAAQTSGSEVLLNFPDLARVMRDSVRTSLSTDEFAFLADRLRSGINIQESVGLTPPFLNPGNPNWTDIANLIDTLQEAIKTGVDVPYA